jgi:hypothetical protein
MNYYLDTEFHEYHKPKTICGIKTSKTIPTIDLISIGIVAEDGRAYYAVSKEFDIDAAWNSLQVKGKIKLHWLRDNVLKPINRDFYLQHSQFNIKLDDGDMHEKIISSLSMLKQFINEYGKSRKQIAQEIIEFVQHYKFDDACADGDRYDSSFGNGINNTYYYIKQRTKSDIRIGTSKSIDAPQFYGYFSAYDWVVFCQLFGTMINLPDGYPWYCHDLIYMLDNTIQQKYKVISKHVSTWDGYPAKTNEHNAISDAEWNKKLHNFIRTI